MITERAGRVHDADRHLLRAASPSTRLEQNSGPPETVAASLEGRKNAMLEEEVLVVFFDDACLVCELPFLKNSWRIPGERLHFVMVEKPTRALIKDQVRMNPFLAFCCQD